MPTIGVSVYWNSWMQKIVASRIRKSKSEIVEEGLKAIQWRLNQDAEELNLAKDMVKQEKEMREAEELV